MGFWRLDSNIELYLAPYSSVFPHHVGVNEFVLIVREAEVHEADDVHGHKRSVVPSDAQLLVSHGCAVI